MPLLERLTELSFLLKFSSHTAATWRTCVTLTKQCQFKSQLFLTLYCTRTACWESSTAWEQGLPEINNNTFQNSLKHVILKQHLLSMQSTCKVCLCCCECMVFHHYPWLNLMHQKLQIEAAVESIILFGWEKKNKKNIILPNYPSRGKEREMEGERHWSFWVLSGFHLFFISLVIYS